MYKDLLQVCCAGLAFALVLSNCGEAQAAKSKTALLIDSKGVKLSVSDAIRMSDAGEKVYRCREVKASVSSSGSSITLKSVPTVILESTDAGQ